MLKYCLDKWNANKDKLEAHLRKDEKIYGCDYKYLVKLVVDIILNEAKSEDEYCYDYRWDSAKITEIDNGDYQGTLLFLIPADAYQPSEHEYLMTYVGYGSCSGCDTLQHIQSIYWYYDDDDAKGSMKLKEKALKEYLTLCKDILTNMIRPYNNGWRQDDRFEVVTMETVSED